jgi:hypothetical protein
MQNTMMEAMDLGTLWTSEPKNFCVGRIVKITEEGQALVDFPGNLMGPVRARSVMEQTPAAGQDSHYQKNLSNQENLSVLLVFENGNSSLPIIVGIIHDKLYPASPPDSPQRPSSPQREVVLPVDRPREGIVDGHKIVFDAREEIVLHCGKSSVTLRKDGKIVIKGAQIVSRASSLNKIKGAAVKIN